MPSHSVWISRIFPVSSGIGEGPLPETELKAFRAALYAAARVAGGEVGEVEERVYPRTFVAGRRGEPQVVVRTTVRGLLEKV